MTKSTQHVAAALAVLAGIAAADAICGLNLKKWSRGPAIPKPSTC